MDMGHRTHSSLFAEGQYARDDCSESFSLTLVPWIVFASIKLRDGQKKYISLTALEGNVDLNLRSFIELGQRMAYIHTH